MTNTKKIIEVTFVELVETLGFNEVIVSDQFNELNNPYIIDLKVMMPYMGNFVVAFSPEMASNLAENFFPKSDTDDELICDTLGEFVNVFVGRVMQKIYPHLAFRIGLPQRVNHLPHGDSIIHSFVDPENRRAIVYSCLEN